MFKFSFRRTDGFAASRYVSAYIFIKKETNKNTKNVKSPVSIFKVKRRQQSVYFKTTSESFLVESYTAAQVCDIEIGEII